jgi:hypothetical protein
MSVISREAIEDGGDVSGWAYEREGRGGDEPALWGWARMGRGHRTVVAAFSVRDASLSAMRHASEGCGACGGLAGPGSFAG